MAFIGNQPTAVPLTSSQLADGLITTDKLAADAVTSAKIADGAIVNVDVNSTAALAYSKLNLATSIVNGDIANATINLTQKVTGTLPTANGGTGLAALGTAGQALVVNSTATALEFATVGATAGQVIQVLSATDDTARSTSGTSFVTASNTLSVTITPSSASNKILILVSTGIFMASDYEGYLTIYRGSTNIGPANGFALTRDGAVGAMCNAGVNYLDSPNTTSATTYQVRFRTVADGPTMTINRSSTRGSITCMEIKG